MKNPFPHTLDNKRYQTWNYYLRKTFGQKVYKVPLSLGVTCPNRDGEKSVGGCTFCYAGGGGTPDREESFHEQFVKAAQPLEAKWPDSLAMPYFQNFSNTYLPAEELDAALAQGIKLPKTVGICVATRPDCLPEDILQVLEKYAEKTFLLVELGLQTVHDSTAQKLNRGHSYAEFLQGYEALTARGIPVCVHLMNGLPGESREDMLETARQVGALAPHSVKFHMLHILENTVLAQEYQKQPFPLLTREEYVEIVCRQLELLPQETVVQRVTGDPPKELLIAPQWTTNKLWVHNAIDMAMAAEDTYQGRYFQE